MDATNSKYVQQGAIVESDKSRPVTSIALGAIGGLPAIPKMKIDRQGWVKFGEKNDFPKLLTELVANSPIQSAINDSLVTYVIGKGAKAKIDKKFIGQPNSTTNWTELLEMLATDYAASGSFYFQVILNNDGKSVSLFHQDWTEVRIGEITDTGEPTSFRISKDWTKTSGKNKPLELEVWPGSISAAKTGVPYMFFYWDYRPGLSLYSLPGYYAANKYIKADGALAEFYDTSIQNGFIVSTVVTMGINPPQEQKDEYERGFRDAFTGPAGATSVVFIWGEDKAVLPTITPFQSTTNADVYNDIQGIVFQQIISANRLASPTLAGISGSGNLSGNAAEIIDAYVLYNATVVNKKRQTLLNQINLFTKINKLAEIAIDDLDIIGQINGDTAEQTTSTADESRQPATLKRKGGFESSFKKLISKLWDNGNSNN